MFEDLKNKVAIITGARRGMGRAHALELAKHGCRVVISDISQEDCQKVVDEIEQKDGEALAIKCDVSKKQEVDELINKTVEKFGKIDILVNNAGIVEFKKFLEMTEEEWSKTIDINLKGYFLCAQAAGKKMAEQNSGAIVNIASVAMGQQGIGMPNIAHYCASKGGIIGLTEALAVELAPNNIRVNAISPGLIETPMIDPIKQQKDQIEALMNRIPMKRTGKAKEVANLVVFLASDASSYMTGSDVIIDGGWLSA